MMVYGRRGRSDVRTGRRASDDAVEGAGDIVGGGGVEEAVVARGMRLRAGYVLAERGGRSDPLRGCKYVFSNSRQKRTEMVAS